jgi:beta-mannosidase
MKLKTAVKNLHEGWKFRQARLTNWYPATVPGVVHTDLLQNKIIEDPFFRLNERGLQWIDKEDWVYETCFTLAADMMRKENMELVFEGLDTYADVYLNDECILKADNMFRRWSIPVRQYIREENNILKVYFHSPVKIDVPKWDALPYQYPASNDQSENGGLFNKKISIFARKAGYHYGWDWGPRLVTSGIWRPVYIRAWSDLRINDVFIEQKEVGAGRAVIAGHVELDADKDMDGVLVTITDEATGRVLGEWQADLKRKQNGQIQPECHIEHTDYEKEYNPPKFFCCGRNAYRYQPAAHYEESQYKQHDTYHNQCSHELGIDNAITMNRL